MLRATTGTRGVERDGRFVIEDPRTVFHAGQDHKVIASFEWEGPTGPHKFEGLWKDPNGKVEIVSGFDYEAKGSPFAGYFTMLVDDSPPTGVWTIEARIDGETAGNFSFEIVSGGDSSPVPLARIPLTSTEAYHQAQAGTVFIEKLDASGKEIGRASGFLIGPDRVVTAFGNIDGASGVRVLFDNGQSRDTTQVMSWNRRQDWAVLKIETQGMPELKPAQAKSWNVGDCFYSLGTSSAGGRTIVAGSIVGDATHPYSASVLRFRLLSTPRPSAARFSMNTATQSDC
jgi:hypothetical protein